LIPPGSASILGHIFSGLHHPTEILDSDVATDRAIMFLSVSDQLGGSEIALLQMIAGIRRLRPSWKVQLVLPGRGPLLDRAERLGADCVILPMPKPLARLGEFGSVNARWPAVAKLVLAARLSVVAVVVPGYLARLRRVTRSAAPTILHTNGVKAHVLGARVDPKLRVIWHVHEYVGSRPLTRKLLRAHEGRVAGIVTNSASVKRDIEAAVSPKAAVHVVHNAVDLETFRPEGAAENLDARAGLPAPSSPVVRVGLVGTFARWKGHDVFLRAIAALPAQSSVRAYVIGEAVYDTTGSQYSLDELKQIARGFGIAERVGFTGFLRSAPAMRALDVVVHASTQPEPFGLVIAEAMACGRAVITSAAGGAAELVRPDHDAVTHAPGDANDLAKAIARLSADANLRRELGARARTAACDRFHPDRLARELVDLYEQVA
jgi:glycosyltransferase involved in cell wall biosynthesis